MPSYSSSRCVPVFPQGPHGSVERLVLPGLGAVPGACPSLIMAPGSCESTPRHNRPNAAAASRSPYEGGSCRPEFLSADLDVLQRLARGEPPRVLAPPCTADQLIRYRWWVGHQAAFGLWRVLAETLTAITQSPSPSPASLAAAARMFDCSTLLYLYTGSCTTAQYNQQLRPAMRDCHPAFSGEWARDFTPLPALVQKARHEFPGELTASLMEASRRSVRVHMAVADELVPEGLSLLQASGHRPGGQPPRHLQALYDSFFLVDRDRVCRQSVTMQLVRRLTQIACDLTHRDPGAPAPRPSALPPACRPDHEGRTDRVLTGIAERPVDVLWNTARHLAKGHDPVVPAAEPSERWPGHEQEPSL